MKRLWSWRKQELTWSIGVALVVVLSGVARAQRPIPYTELDVSVWQYRDNASGTGWGGARNLIDPDKADTQPALPMTRTDVTDPSTWVLAGQSWMIDWQGNFYALTNHPSCPLTDDPWIIFDLGTHRELEKMHVWNVSEATGLSRGTADFNLYYATAPTSAIPGWAKAGTLPGSPTNYNFQSGGWTQFGSTFTVDKSGSPYALDLEIDFSNSVASARYIGMEMKTNHGDSNGRAGLNTVVFTEVDATPPDVSFTNDASGVISVYNPVNYTVTFSEEVDPSSVTNGTFSNVANAPASYVMDDLSQRAANVFDLVITPTTLGSFQLQVSSNVTDLAGNPMAGDVTDVDVISVEADVTPPEVVSFVDSRDGGPMGAGQSVMYTVTFNEHIESSTVSVDDFVNASGAVVTVSSVTTGAVANVFYVDVTPQEAGFLYLELTAESIANKSGITNNVAWYATNVITVVASDAADGTWDVNADGEWGEVSNWQSNIVARGTDRTATFPNIITSDRTVTLDTDRTIGNIVFADLDRHLSIGGGNTLTLAVTNGMPEINVVDEELTISSVIAGSNGVSKTGKGLLLMSGANTFTGGIDFSAGTIKTYNNANEQSFLGDAANVLTFSGNAELNNANGGVTLPQAITINDGVTAQLTGAFGESTDVNGVLAGSGTMRVRGNSAGWNIDFLNTSNTFTGPIQIVSGDSARLGMRSLVDSTNTIELQSNAGNGGKFEYLSGAITPLVLNNRQFKLISDGDATTNLGRAPTIANSASTSNTITISTDLQITGTGTKFFVLRGGNTGDNTFAGNIPDAIGAAALHLYKFDGGTWVLSGQNTYSGTTTVDAGRLVLEGEQALLDSGTLDLDGGTVEVRGREKVGALQFSGVPSSPATGTWGSPTSGAENTDASFIGDGVLYVGVNFPPTGTILFVK